MKDLTGTRLGQYEIVERLGGGGMAVVYRAVQQPLGREVALKALMPNLIADEGFIKRFEQEARTLARLDHPNILPIIDFMVTPSVVFLTMPLVRGGTLRDILDRGPLDGATAWRYLREVGQGLQHAHDAGIIHRDLKPNNVLIHSDGRALLADFGLARSAGQDVHLTDAGFTLGTPGYMAPEQVLGQDLDPRADIYAMGVMTFEMMTGRMPFAGATPVEIAIATVSSPVPSAAAINPVLPDELDQVLAVALAKDRARRPASVRELVALLARVPQYRTAAVAAVAAAPAATPPPTPAPPASRPRPQVHPIAASPTVARLEPKGTTCADWYFASAVRAAREVAGSEWPAIAGSGGISDAAADPPTGEGFTYPLATLGALTTAFESTFGAAAPAKLAEWGRHATERMLAERRSGGAEQRALKLVPGKRRLGVLLKAYVESLDEMRGEPAHAWRQVDPDRYWIVHYQNPFASDRPKQDRSCHYSVAAYETMLRWSGLANDWLVDEIECGTVTGTGDCVFGLRSTKT